jgi:replication factor C small subunit
MALEVWTEKYRPQLLDEVKGQDDIIFRLKAFVTSSNMPHVLFAGPAGVGKTTSALAIARELYGETWKDNILELNASDERGIDVIRTKVKDFARSRALEGVPFKLVYLDEADALTKEAQQALRRTMEDYAASTRFILSCNWSSNIISPIQSRCAVFRYKPLPKDVLFEILKKISSLEELEIDDAALELMYEASEGDCRKAENLLQAVASITKDINAKAVTSVVSFAEPKEIANIVELAIKGKFVEAKKRLTDVMIKHGLSGMDVIKQMQKSVWSLDVDERLKVLLIRACGEYEFRLVEGSNEFIQLAALLADFSVIGSNEN